MKTCSICHISKSLDSYNRHRSKKDGLQTHCRDCAHIRFRKYYQSNLQKQKAVVLKRNRERKIQNQEDILNYLKSHPCVDCGETDYIVLEFDHVRGKKKGNISKMIGNNCWRTILGEIQKCDVRCANCHRRKTHKEQNNYRSI